MAKLNKIGRFLIEDYSGLPKWGETLFEQLNKFVDSTQEAMDRKLTVGDNMAGSILEVKFKTPTDPDSVFPITTALAAAPKAVLVGGMVDATSKESPVIAPPIAWSWSKGTLSITDISGLDANRTYRLTLVALNG